MKRGWIAAAGATGLALGIGFAAGGAGAPEETGAAEVAVLSQSIRFLERRVAVDPENTLAAGHLADRYLLRFQLAADLGDVRRAEAVSRAMLPVAPDPAGARARLSHILLTQHEFTGALEAAERAVAADSLNAGALAALFDAAMATGRYEQARAALDRLPPGSLSHEIRGAQWLMTRGELEGAFHRMDRVCREFEGAGARPQMVAWCRVELAGIEQERSGEDRADALLHRALEAQPGYRGATEGLADLAHARGDWKRAARLYAGIATDAHPDLYLRLAEVHRQLGDAERSARYRREFLRVATAPGAEALYAHPLALFLAERPETRDAALAVALRDVTRRPAVDSYDVLSWVRFRRGEFAEALAASDRAHARGSPSPTMLYHRARILEALGREREAAPLLQQALARPDLLEPHARLGDR